MDGGYDVTDYYKVAERYGTNDDLSLIKLRKRKKYLQADGETEFLYANKNKYPLIVKRKSSDGSCLVLINPCSTSVNCAIQESIDITDTVFEYEGLP